MKQRIMIKVQMSCKKCKVKTMQIVATTSGVESVALGGDNTIIVIGEEVDLVSTVSELRKKVGKASVVSVEEVKEQKELQNQDNHLPGIESPSSWPYDHYSYNYATGYYVTDAPVSSYHNTPTCNIM